MVDIKQTFLIPKNGVLHLFGQSSLSFGAGTLRNFTASTVRWSLMCTRRTMFFWRSRNDAKFRLNSVKHCYQVVPWLDLLSGGSKYADSFLMPNISSKIWPIRSKRNFDWNFEIRLSSLALVLSLSIILWIAVSVPPLSQTLSRTYENINSFDYNHFRHKRSQMSQKDLLR